MAGRILYGAGQGTYVLKLQGDVRVPLCASLDDFLVRMFDDPQMLRVVIDLSHTENIDSTALGMLARIAVILQQQGKKKPFIVCSNEDVLRILSSMGFTRVFRIVRETPTLLRELHEIPCVEKTPDEVGRNVLEAHRTLMGLSRENEEAFRALVEALEQEQQAIASGECMVRNADSAVTPPNTAVISAIPLRSAGG